jgi:hypothetical protein
MVGFLASNGLEIVAYFSGIFNPLFVITFRVPHLL